MATRPFPLRRLGFVGGGQLARMGIYRGAKLGFHFTVLDPDKNAGAAPLADRALVGGLYDRQSLTELVTSCEVTTYDIEHCDTAVLAELEALGHCILPSPRLLQTVQDKVLQKQAYLDAGLPVAPFVDKALNALVPQDFPVVQKARTGGYDGRGVVLLREPADVSKALPGHPERREGSFLEACVPFEKELGVMVARAADGSSVVYPVTEMVFDPELNICTHVLAPAPIPASVASRAAALAVSVVEALNGVGVFGVELFLTRGGELLVNETAPRPHNSGHYTMEACRTCQFENHLRAVSGLPLGDPGFHSPAVMVNLLGQGPAGPTRLEGLDEALATPGFSLHLYGKAQSRPGRKMGHFTVTAATAEQAWQRASAVEAALKVRGAEVPDVGIIMGSDSDLPVMAEAAAVLASLGVSAETTIVSAHRTPARLTDYATQARARGLKVIVAGAGGAAHLPGMVASHTVLPVVGVPIQTKAFQGLDSLLSIVQMPAGIPVATVAVNGGKNAGLLAARILAVTDEPLADRLEAYARTLESEVLFKAARLETEGPEAYLSAMKRS